MAVIPLSLLTCLAVVLCISGVAKLASPDAGLRLLAGLPLPRPLRGRRVRGMLPWVEILIGLALVLASGAVLRLASAAALLLFTLFTAVVVRESRRPDPASCGCFGDLSRAPVSGRTAVRNVVFTALAAGALLAVTVGHARGPVLGLPSDVLLALLIPLVLALVCLWAEHPGARGDDAPHDVSGIPPLPAAPRDSDPAQDTDEYERLPIPYASLTDAQHTAVTLRELAASEARALFFVSPTCGGCVPVLDRLDALGDHLGPVALHAVVTHAEQRALLPEQLREASLVDADGATSGLFDQRATPWAVVLGADGLLAGGPVLGGGAVLELLEELKDRFAS